MNADDWFMAYPQLVHICKELNEINSLRLL